MPAVVSGAFTKYGNVLPLLLTANDEFVIFGRGDQLQLYFETPATAVAEGNARTIVFRGTIYYKGLSSNGGSPTPLPYKEMPNFPYPADHPYPAELHGDYLTNWLTRVYTQQQSHYTLYTDYMSCSPDRECPLATWRTRRLNKWHTFSSI